MSDQSKSPKSRPIKTLRDHIEQTKAAVPKITETRHPITNELPALPTIRNTIGDDRRDWKDRYLAELESNGGRVRKACEVAGISTATVWGARKEKQFAVAEVEAFNRARTTAEDEVRRRAIDGVVTQRIIYPDGRIAEKIEYSDTLLLRLLVRMETGSWAEKQTSGNDIGVPLFATRAERKAALDRAREERADGQARLAEEPIAKPEERS